MNYFFLSNTGLFRGLNQQEIKQLLPCLGAYEKSYAKDDIIFRAGDTVNVLGLVENGGVNIQANFYWGGSNIFGHIGKGDIFAQNYAAIPGKELNCDIIASEKTDILFINMQKLLTSCQSACSFHHRIICNLVKLSALKNLSLSARMMHIAPKSIRDRVLSYLSEQATENMSPNFTIPFSRQQLAEYLGVDRSALSNELSKMQKDGLISYHKNDFRLKEF
ncbi:MAG: Crp/Fnr family transcriptional regulator [Sphaerochaeta sp.]